MNQRFANPSTLGYAGFAITLWMVSMINAGWFSPSQHTMDLMLAVTFGGTAMGIAGVMEFFRGRTLDMLLFLAFGSFWWAWALHATGSGQTAMPATAGGFMGWFFLLWAIVAFYVWIASFHSEGTARMLFTLGLWLSFLALAIADWSASTGFTVLGGYLGLITAIIGGYISAADVINFSYERVVLPTGEHDMEHLEHGHSGSGGVVGHA